MKLNKKGMAVAIPFIIIGLIAVSALFVFAIGAVAKPGGSIESLIDRESGCSAPDLLVSLQGDLLVSDGDYIGVTAVAQDLKILEVRQRKASDAFAISNNLGIFSDDYTWSVELVDASTNNVQSRDGGQGNHPGGDAINDETFLLSFRVPDNNCDGRVDDFNGKIVAKVKSESNPLKPDDEVSTLDKRILFRNGAWELS